MLWKGVNWGKQALCPKEFSQYKRPLASKANTAPPSPTSRLRRRTYLSCLSCQYNSPSSVLSLNCVYYLLLIFDFNKNLFFLLCIGTCVSLYQHETQLDQDPELLSGARRQSVTSLAEKRWKRKWAHQCKWLGNLKIKMSSLHNSRPVSYTHLTLPTTT